MRKLLKMSTLDILLKNNDLATDKLKALKRELEILKHELIEHKKDQYIKENASLAKHVEELRSELIFLETRNGKQQIAIPGDENLSSITKKGVEQKWSTNQSSGLAEPSVEGPPLKSQKSEKDKKPKKEKPPATSAKNEVNKAEESSSIDVGLLDLRIGKIVEISQHPDADSLYLEKIDCGESVPRTVISGLVKFVPIEEMRDRLVVVLCNLKPAKMRGIVSEAMVMCASTPEKVEVLAPPPGSNPGDLVHCEGYDRNPPSQLNPKKKIFESVALDLKTNSDLIACFKGSPLFVPGKGNIVAQSLRNVNIK